MLSLHDHRKPSPWLYLAGDKTRCFLLLCTLPIAGNLSSCAHNKDEQPSARKAAGRLGMSEEGFWKRHKHFFDEHTLKRKLTCKSKNAIPENVSEDAKFKDLYAGVGHNLCVR